MAADEDLTIQVKAATAQAERALARTWADVNRLNSELDRGNGAANKWAKGQEAAAEQVRQAQSKIGTAFLAMGAAGLAGLGLATKAAIDWETAWAGVTKTVSASPAQFGELEGQLRELARTLPATHQEIAGVAEAAGQLGIARTSLVAFTRTMVDLGVSTDLSAEEAATGIAQMMNVMQSAPDDVDNLGAALVALGNNGASTESQILDMSTRFAAAGHNAGLAEVDVLAFSNAAASVGVNAEAGGSALSLFATKISDAVLDGSGDLDTIAQVAGTTSAEFQRAYGQDAASAIAMFVSGLGRMSDSGQSVTPVMKDLGLNGIRARQAVLSLANAGDLLTESLDTGRQAWKDNTALVAEATKRYETTASKIAIAKNNINDAAISAGEVLLPAVASVTDKIADFAGWMSRLPAPVQATIVSLVGLASVSLLAGGAYLKLVANSKKLLELMEVGPGAISKVTSAFKGLGAAAAIAAVAFAGVQIGHSIEEWKGYRLSVDDLEAALVRLGGTSKTTGPLLKTFGVDLTGLGEDLRQAADASWIDKGLGPFGANAFVDNINNIDEALSNIVGQGDVEAAAAAFEMIAAKAREQGLSMEQINKLFPAYQESLKNHAIDAAEAAKQEQELAAAQARTERTTPDLTAEQELLADKLGLSVEGVVALTDGLDTLSDTIDGILDQHFGLEEAQDTLQSKLNDLTESIYGSIDAFNAGEKPVDDWTFTLDGTTDAALTNRDTLRGLVDFWATQLVPQIVKNSSTQDEATGKVEASRQALEDQLVALGFSRDGVRDYTGAVEDVPDLVETLFEQIHMAESQAAADGLNSKYTALLGPNGQGWHTYVYANTESAWNSLTPLQQAIASWAAQDATKHVHVVYDESYATGYTGLQDLKPPTHRGGAGWEGSQSQRGGAFSVQEQGALAGTLSIPVGGLSGLDQGRMTAMLDRLAVAAGGDRTLHVHGVGHMSTVDAIQHAWRMYAATGVWGDDE